MTHRPAPPRRALCAAAALRGASAIRPYRNFLPFGVFRVEVGTRRRAGRAVSMAFYLKSH